MAQLLSGKFGRLPSVPVLSFPQVVAGRVQPGENILSLHGIHFPRDCVCMISQIRNKDSESPGCTPQQFYVTPTEGGTFLREGSDWNGGSFLSFRYSDFGTSLLGMSYIYYHDSLNQLNSLNMCFSVFKFKMFQKINFEIYMEKLIFPNSWNWKVGKQTFFEFISCNELNDSWP